MPTTPGSLLVLLFYLLGVSLFFGWDDLTKLATCFHESSVPLINSRFGRVRGPHISVKKDRRIQDF